METFQENLEHQKRGKGRKRQQTDRIAQRDGLARPPVGMAIFAPNSRPTRFLHAFSRVWPAR